MSATFRQPSKATLLRVSSVKSFAALYGAAEFSLLNGHPLGSHLIINWTALGIDGVYDVGAGFSAFTKCLRDYLTRRHVPPLWLYCHERGPTTGWHTHFAIFLPVDADVLRAEFMDWLRSWPIRHVGRRVPRAVRMRIPKKHEIKLHWLLFNYLMKGYDPRAIVQSARHAPGGQDIMLGDLISFPCRDPGVISLRKRVGFSQSLGPAEQANGIPAAWTGLKKSGVAFRLTPDALPSALPTPSRFAFRSTFDDACYDVRQLYGVEFAEWVTGACAGNMSASSNNKGSSMIENILGGYV